MRRRLTIVLVVFVIGAPFGLRWINSMARPTHSLGVTDGKLAPCPNKPNCVSSQATDDEHQVESFPIRDSAQESMSRLRSIIESMSGSVIVEERPEYLHAEFRTPLLGFIDDVELLVNEGQTAIDCRSGSRTGYSDLGVNRRRIEEIRQAFLAQSSTGPT